LIRAVLLGIFYAVMIPLVAIIGFPWTFISGRVDRLYQMAMIATAFGMRLIGVEVNILGREKLDAKGTYIYMCNHVSNLDPPIVVPSIPRRTSVMVKKELFRIPILSKAMLMASFVPVDRRNREAAIASIDAAVDVLKQGVNITIFPEGTRSPDGKLLPFKKGPFHLRKQGAGRPNDDLRHGKTDVKRQHEDKRRPDDADFSHPHPPCKLSEQGRIDGGSPRSDRKRIAARDALART
jgi:1-acyl-sn-glycerol-3-phosphate acyltransferase